MYLGIIIGLAINIFLIWLIYNGLVETLKATPESAKIVSYVLICLIVLFLIIGIGARNRASRFLNDFNNNKDVKELLKEIKKE
jgi:hypothetical protein